MIADDDPQALELRAAVWADPAADGPRTVYADYLLQREDPLGELISLQLERARTGGAKKLREDQLRVTDGRRAAKPIEVALSQFVLERGFVSSATALSGMSPALALHPAWSTLERITLQSSPHPLLGNPHLGPFALNASDEILGQLALREDPLAAASLVDRPHSGRKLTRELLAVFDHRGAFDRVRAISVAVSESVFHMLATRLGRQLEHVEVTFPDIRREELDQYVNWFDGSHLARLTVVVPLELGSRGAKLLRLTIDRSDTLRAVLDEPVTKDVGAVTWALKAMGTNRRRLILQDAGDAPEIDKRQKALIKRLPSTFEEVVIDRGPVSR